MESNKILQADILDILFEGKNKEYGAYELRKTYNGRLVKSLIVTGSVIALLIGGWFLSRLQGSPMKSAPNVDDIELAKVETQRQQELTPPIPKPIIPKAQTIQFTPPKIVQDKDVKENEKPPEVEKLDDVKISTANVEGLKDDGLVAPPNNYEGKGVVAAPKKDEDDYDKLFTKVEIESSYPGGMEAWARFLHKNLRIPDEAINNNIQGTVTVQFIVDKEGNVSDVEAVGGPEGGGLREEVIRVIKKSGKWTPAIQNGRQVKSYKRQPVVIKIDPEQ
jgi:protein TonB